MKILEAQSAVLTNVEVYTFLSNQAKQYNDQKRKGPTNLETLRKEVLQYFESPPGPLSQKPLPFDAAVIPELIKRLRQYQITKGECIMLFNIRPTNVPVLNTVIEDMEDRFNSDQQQEILDIVTEVLGQFPQELEDGDQGEGVMETTENGHS
ncbi:putative rna polymerase iii subunit c17 protein [Daldinia childiae]|uniref:putative rna polymerase iii subunit c17 protein n=1 Tax=Daldinia childiae TaxID=326645 RepID=UPI0014487CF4|nr:putative rna polymerase iii subunit c17 protein [Daldinia childiae]KAF3071179.1 putative rna polymerase iii subunit c17 protein [Daldinia childiae]